MHRAGTYWAAAPPAAVAGRAGAVALVARVAVACVALCASVQRGEGGGRAVAGPAASVCPLLGGVELSSALEPALVFLRSLFSTVRVGLNGALIVRWPEPFEHCHLYSVKKLGWHTGNTVSICRGGMTLGLLVLPNGSA